MRWPPVPGELAREEAEPAGEGPRTPPPALPLSGSERGGHGAEPRDPRTAGLLYARRFPSTVPARRFPVRGPQSTTADKPVRRAQVRAEGSGRLGWPGMDAAGGVRRVEAALPVAVTALPGRVALGLPYPHAPWHCCSFSRRLSGVASGFPGRSRSRTGGLKATAPPIVGCVGSGQCAASIRQVSANLDEFLPKTLAAAL